MQPLGDLAAQIAPLKDDQPQKGHHADDQAVDPGDAVAVDAAAVDAEKQQDIRQKPDADVHQQIHQRVGGEPAVEKRKDKITYQRYTAQDRHHKIETIAGIAGEPVGKRDERRDEQQQVEHQPGTVVAAAQKHPQHRQPSHAPHQYQQAEMQVGGVQQQEVDRPGNDRQGKHNKSNDLIKQAGAVDARRRGREPGTPLFPMQAVLAQRAVAGVAAHLDMTMRAGLHFSTSVAYSVTCSPASAKPR